MFFGTLICLVVLIGAAVGLEAAGLQWYAPWRADKQTEITRNTNQYVTTQQETILDALRRYNDPNATSAQKGGAVDDMCRAANRIDDEFVPVAAREPMNQRGCWTGGI